MVSRLACNIHNIVTCIFSRIQEAVQGLLNKFLNNPLFSFSMITEIEPKGFSPKFHSTGIYLIHDGRFVTLKRSDDYKGKWSTPGGGIEKGEDPHDTIVREVKEEGGLTIEKTKLRKV